jgi:hypothetical protein
MREETARYNAEGAGPVPTSQGKSLSSPEWSDTPAADLLPKVARRTLDQVAEDAERAVETLDKQQALQRLTELRTEIVNVPGDATDKAAIWRRLTALTQLAAKTKQAGARDA